MSATINWVIEYMNCKPSDGPYTDVVITAGWRCIGSELTGVSPNQVNVLESCFGECSFSEPSGSFTPYADLTQDQVLNWCYSNGVDKSLVEAQVFAKLDKQINPPVITPPLPWSN